MTFSNSLDIEFIHDDVRGGSCKRSLSGLLIGSLLTQIILSCDARQLVAMERQREFKNNELLFKLVNIIYHIVFPKFLCRTHKIVWFYGVPKYFCWILLSLCLVSIWTVNHHSTTCFCIVRCLPLPSAIQTDQSTVGYTFCSALCVH